MIAQKKFVVNEKKEILSGSRALVTTKWSDGSTTVREVEYTYHVLGNGKLMSITNTLSINHNK